MDKNNTVQVEVSQLKVGGHVVTLNGDRWTIVTLENCNRQGALEKDGPFYSVNMRGPNKTTRKMVWHKEAKVLVDKKDLESK